MNAIVKAPQDITVDMNEPFYIDRKGVSTKATISNSTIRKLELNGQFPKRITLSHNKIVWVHAEVHNWCILVKKLKGYPKEGYYTE